MGRKNVLTPVVLESAKSLSASFVTSPTTVLFQDNLSYQINITTSDAVGTFSIEASNNYQEQNSLDTADAGDWLTLTLDGTPTLASTSDIIGISLNQFPYKAIRLRYTRTSGTGAAEILIAGRCVGS